MLFSAHQPQYLPWLGFFEKIDRADRFVLLDDVQYKKNEWQNRNRIKTPKGPQWLTVPVKAHLGQKINEVPIDNSKSWVKDHLKSLETNYHRAPFFEKIFPQIEKVLTQKEWDFLGGLNIALIKTLLNLLEIPENKIVLSSSLKIKGKSTQRLVEIGQTLEAFTYLSGQDGEKYLDLELFNQAQIKVAFQQYQHPVYAQLFDDFQSHLSVVDLLFNCGPKSLSVLRKG